MPNDHAYHNIIIELRIHELLISDCIIAKSKALTCCIQYDVNNRAKETEKGCFFYLQQQSAEHQLYKWKVLVYPARQKDALPYI